MHWIKRWQNRTTNPWKRAMIGALPILFWVNVVRFFFSLLTWVLGLYFGDANPFWLNTDAHLEWTVVILSTVNAMHLGQHLFPAPRWRKQGTVKVIAAVIGMTVGGVLMDLYYQQIFPLLGYVYDLNIVYFDVELPSYMTNTVTYFIFSLFLSIPILIQHQRAEKHRLELKVRELEVQRLAQLKDTAKLEALQAKINPHFLYNSLNSIVSLVHIDPNRAEEMILALSELFRYSLHSPQGNYATVGEELKMAEIYLRVEKIRFDEQLRYTLKTDPAAIGYLIPKFVIQPLLENAIKHGTSRVEQGEITLSVELTAGKLRIEITDNGPPFPSDFTTGYGLLSIREKLELLFPGAARMEIHPENPKSVILTFSQLLTDAPEV